MKLTFTLILNYLILFSNYANTTLQKLKNETQAIAIPADLSPLSRIISNNQYNGFAGQPPNSAGSQLPKIKYETYKALAGETVRLECPQPNPTWFFRKASDSTEDLIVTRHGIINADYKYKIMCHMTLKHKVIIINNIDFDEEGLYTCLYTQPVELSKSNAIPSLSASINSFYANNLNENGNGNGEASLKSNDLSNPVQFRYVFNVTVYSKCFLFNFRLFVRLKRVNYFLK